MTTKLVFAMPATCLAAMAGVVGVGLSKHGGIRLQRIGLLGLLCFMLPGSLRAGTIYTYTGEAYTTCNHTCGPLSITFGTSLSGAALDNLPLTDITSTITSYDITDNSGEMDIYNGDGQTISQFAFIIGTNAVGDITSWYITEQETAPPPGGYQEITSYCGHITVEYSVTGYSDYSANSESNPPEGGTTGSESDAGCGTAPLIMVPSTPTGTPEPSPYLMLGTGLGLLALAARSKRHAPPASS